MVTFHIAVEVKNLLEDRFEFLEALVDTAASHSIFPERLPRELGIEPAQRWPFRLADGTQREFDVGTGRARINGRTAYTNVVFAADDSEARLGSILLTELGLGVDPTGSQPISVPSLLVSVREA